MSLIKSTRYAPDIYKSLSGILLVHKQPKYSLVELLAELRERLCDDLNQLEQRPLSRRLAIVGGCNEEKKILDVPNLADHPLVVGPRYVPTELNIKPVLPWLGFRSSGLVLLTVGKALRYKRSLKSARLPSVYHIEGQFGYKTHNHFCDGNILDKHNYHNVRTGKMDSVLSRIESSQRNRLFQASRVPIQSQEAYELAQRWPAKPPRMARWPIIYRIRCRHLKLPHFKLEVTIANESESFLAELVNDVAVMLKSGAYTNSVKRVKYGPYTIDDSLTEKQWDLQSVIDNLKMNHDRRDEIIRMLETSKENNAIQTQYNVPQLEARAH